MFGGQVKVPMVIRMPQGAGHQLGPTHSHSFEAIYLHVPGLLVAVPSTAADAKGLLKAAIRDDNPVIFMENEIGHLISELGADRIVFGTGMPFNYPDPALLKLEVLAATSPLIARMSGSGGTCFALYPDAVRAYEQLVRLAPQEPAVLADYADALAMRNGRKISGPPLELVQQALKIDPVQPKALAMAGTEALARSGQENRPRLMGRHADR